MKRLLLGAAIFGVLAVLTGCPIYSDNGNYRICNGTGCYDCPDTTLSGACVRWACNTSADCGDNSVCTSAGTCGPATSPTTSNMCCDSSGLYCVPCNNVDAGTECSSQAGCPSGWVCGRDSTCHEGDCGGNVGCVGGLQCRVEDGVAQCVSADASTSVGPVTHDGGVAEASVDAARTTTDAGEAADASDATVAPPPDGAAAEASTPIVLACNADSQCSSAGGGAKCINGDCAAESQLCSDATQCAVLGDSCVNGICTPTCSASAPCAAGFACDFTRGVCSENPRVCVANTDCQGGTVCVEAHCTAPCDPNPEAASACPATQLCVNGGCIPDQHATFACLNDGQEGPLANKCDAADICLHGDCYAACDTSLDGGDCATGMICKEVTISKGTFAVCGTATTLGSACDPATGAACTGTAVCIDGYCK